jgi:hypothetical protein
MNLERKAGESDAQYQLRSAQAEMARMKERLDERTRLWRDSEEKVHELEELRKVKLPEFPQKLDFRKITRPGSITTVNVTIDYTRCPWLLFGQCYLRQNDGANKGNWRLGAYLADATDFEHDSAHALSFPLIGVHVTAADYGTTHIQGWIDPQPRWSEDFCIPPKGYDPRKHPDAEMCPQCKGKKGSENQRHIMVPEGFYSPPKNPELFKQMRGLKVEIDIGPKSNVDYWLKWEAKRERG